MGISIDPTWHDRQIQQYSQEREQYKHYTRVLEDILQAACHLYAPLAIVQARAKTLSSFAEKVVRKAGKYQDPVHQLTDLCGARVITQTQAEVDRISKFIQETFIIDVANSVDKRATLGVAEFGYLSVHYIVQLPRPEEEAANETILGVRLPAELVTGGYKAEIQVRTLLQHAWAGISHDSLYKNMFKPPAQWHREMNRLAATLEEADQSFDRFVHRLETYAANHGAYLPAEKRQAEIDTLKMILAKEPERELKSAHALRIAGMCRAAENWAESIEVLMPFSAEQNFRLLRELGYALCRANRQNTGHADYRKGVELLTSACEIEPADAQTHSCLAWALRNGRQPEESQRVRAHLAKAYELQPANPYYLAAYLESEILIHDSLSHVSLMRPTLLKAIETCHAHIDANIEIPLACFTTGRLYLYLKMPYASLHAYLEGLRMCLSDHGLAQYELLQAELDFLRSLAHLQEQLPGYEAALRLLTIAGFMKIHGKGVRLGVGTTVAGQDTDGACVDGLAAEGASLKQVQARLSLEALQTPALHYQLPVTIIAGSCATAEETHMRQYQGLLQEALGQYRGGIISGGTLNGIGGLVGDLMKNNDSGAAGALQTIAYLPRLLPAHAQVDARYSRHITTASHDFSLLEPLQMWVDLLASDIDPQEVKLLGIGGGAISAFEYRLAITLGAQVGIVHQSGREADALLQDAAWNTADCLLPLVNDRMTVRSFATTPHPIIAPDRLEEMAMKAHESYRQMRMLAPRKEPNLQPWEKLLPDLQNSNRHQVACSVDILRQAGFSIEPATAGEVFPDPEFTAEEIELMAEMEHGRWNAERLRSGWRYGEEKDEAARITPYLVSWTSLSDEIKGYDREVICNLSNLLWQVGLKITRCR